MSDPAVYATIEDLESLWRPMSQAEKDRANGLIPIVSAQLRLEAGKDGKNLDEMIAENPDVGIIAKSVTVDVVARALNTATTGEPMTQESQSALGYSWSGSYLVPGGGLFIKKSELARLGLKQQKIMAVNIYEDKGHNC